MLIDGQGGRRYLGTAQEHIDITVRKSLLHPSLNSSEHIKEDMSIWYYHVFNTSPTLGDLS